MKPDSTATTHGVLQPGRARFELIRHEPASDVADWVERHWIVRWDLPDGESFTQEVLPHPCVNLVSEPGLVAVHGIPSTRSRHRLEGAGMAVGTKFRPGGFTALSGAPAGRLADRATPLADVFGDRGAAIERRLVTGLGDPRAHIDAVEELVRSRPPARDRRYDQVRTVVADMLVADRALGVADLAARHAMSERTLQRIFREYVGVSPKWVLKRYRVHEAAERIAAGEAGDAVRLALDLGYFDQSHFIRDFTAQVGHSPGTYARMCAAARGQLSEQSRRAA